MKKSDAVKTVRLHASAESDRDSRSVLLNLKITGRVAVKMTADDYKIITSKLADGKEFPVPDEYWPKIMKWLVKEGKIAVVDAQMVKLDGTFDTTHHESPLFKPTA
jgi:hypothetical protein